MFALPYAMHEEGVRRYGFHGLSYEYIASVLPQLRRAAAGAHRRAAPGQRRQHVRAARRPQRRQHDGLHRRRRPADGHAHRQPRPGVVLYLMDERGMDARAIEKLLYQPVRPARRLGHLQRHAHAAGERRAARQACDRPVRATASGASWARWPRRWAGSTRSCSPAGIGENSRRDPRARLPRRGLARRRARRAANAAGGPRISTADSRVAAWVMPTNEELMIARHTASAGAIGTLAPMNPEDSAAGLSGAPSAGGRHRQRALDRLGLRQGVPRTRRRRRRHLPEREGAAARRAAGARARGADLHAARRQRAGRARGGVRAIARAVGPARHPVHSIAFAPKDDLQGGLLNCSAEGFAKAMDVSCHSFVRMARLAAPLMTDGGTMFAMSYHGARRWCRTTT
jgi:hypothetical protein